MADELVVDITNEDGAVVVTCAGDIDIANVARFRAALVEPATSLKLVVDLGSVSYLDSAGIAALFERAKKGPLEVVAGPGCAVRRVLEVVALDQVATLRATR